MIPALSVLSRRPSLADCVVVTALLECWGYHLVCAQHQSIAAEEIDSEGMEIRRGKGATSLSS